MLSQLSRGIQKGALRQGQVNTEIRSQRRFHEWRETTLCSYLSQLCPTVESRRSWNKQMLKQQN